MTMGRKSYHDVWPPLVILFLLMNKITKKNAIKQAKTPLQGKKKH